MSAHVWTRSLLTAMFAFVLATRVEAQVKVSVVIENPTSNTIRYRLVWDTEGWRWFTLPPYKSYTHSLTVQGGWGADPQISYDWICGNNQFDEKLLRLRGQDRYYFRYTSCGRFLYLYRR